MAVIGVAGLPGSGKSGLMYELQRQGYRRFNDINKDWQIEFPRARAAAWQGRDVAISDIMFCDEAWRRRLESQLGLAVQWIFFENDVEQCLSNCRYRFRFEKHYRPLETEVRMIRELSAKYWPYGDVRPVVRADAYLKYA